MRLSTRLARYERDVLAPWPGLGEPRRLSLYRRAGLDIGDRTRLAPGLRIYDGRISIGADCYLNSGSVLDPGDADIVIEDGVTVGVDVVLAAAGHRIGPSHRRAGGTTARPIRVCNGSWLGARVVVLAGVRIASGCVIGAGAVVTHDTEPDGIYVGVPARRMRDLERNDDLQSRQGLSEQRR